MRAYLLNGIVVFRWHSDVFIWSSSLLPGTSCENGGRRARRLCEYRPPRLRRTPRGWGEACALLGLRRCLLDPAFTCWEVGEGSLLKFLSIQMDMKQWLGQLSAFLSTCLSKKGEGRCLPVGVDSFQSTWFKVEHSQAFQTLLFWMS